MSQHLGVEYRADIDGLRAVAVVAVVLFHAKVPPFGGGYIGVDVFFVISGFLIASILSSDMQRGRFSIASFYERRIRRIFPALFFVLLVITIAAAILLAPLDFVAYARSAIATTLSASNVLFWHQAGYFDASAYSKPLLHTWSLAVEEQFYVVFPLALYVASRFGVRHVVWLLPSLILSLALAILLMKVHPISAFYLAPPRAWEMLLGAGLALNLAPPPHTRLVRNVVSALGLGLILGPIFVFGEGTPFPGWNAIYPCAGSAMLIWSGAKGQSLIGRVLSHPGIVFVGLISYSLYLWHWPVLVLMQYYRIFQLGSVDIAFAVLLSFGLAVASWRYVEQPMRRVPLSRARVFQGAAVASTLLIATSVAVVWSKGWQGRYPHDLEVRYEEARLPTPGSACTASIDRWREPKDACVYGAAGVTPTWAIWGDSHAGAIGDALGAEMARQGKALRIFSYAACPPMNGVRQVQPVGNLCFEYSNQVMRSLIEDESIRDIVLFGRYAQYIYGHMNEFGPAENGDHPFITDEAAQITDAQGRARLFVDRLSRTVALLRRAGKRIYLLYPVPETGYDIPSTLLRLEAKGVSPSAFTTPYSRYWARNRVVISALDNIEGPHISHLRTVDMFCDASSCRVADEQGRALYRDSDHLSALGARILVERIIRPELAASAAE